jgi:hypothetical protein
MVDGGVDKHFRIAVGKIAGWCQVSEIDGTLWKWQLGKVGEGRKK